MTSKSYLLNAWSMIHQICVYYGCECFLNTPKKNSIQPSVDSYTIAISMTIFIITYIVAVFLFLGFVMNKLKRRIRCCFLSQVDLKWNKLLFVQWLPFMVGSNFKLKTSFNWIRMSHGCMHLYETWPSITCAHRTPNVWRLTNYSIPSLFYALDLLCLYPNQIKRSVRYANMCFFQTFKCQERSIWILLIPNHKGPL